MKTCRLVILLALLLILGTAAAAADVLILPPVEEISQEAFCGDVALEEVVLPEGLKVIGPRAFAGCSGLQRVRFPSSLQSIAEDAFDGCPDMVGSGVPYTAAAEFCEKKHILFEAESTPLKHFTVRALNDREAEITGFDGETGSSRVLIIPERTADGRVVTTIGDHAFEMLSRIDAVILPNTVRTIGAYAFRQNHWLKSIRLPRDLVEIGPFAFYDCALEDIVFGESLKIIGAGAFALNRTLTEVNLPDSVEEMRAGGPYEDYGVFSGCSSLSSVHYPKNLRQASFFEYAEDSDFNYYSPHFSLCPKLTCVEVPEGVTFIPQGMFAHMEQLEHVSLPSTLQSIQRDAFSFSGLTEISIPDSVTEIGTCAFGSCKQLSSVKLPAGLTVLDRRVFTQCDLLTDIDLPEGLTTISAEAFQLTPIARVTVPQSVQWYFSTWDSVPRPISMRGSSRLFPVDAEIWTEYGTDALEYAQNHESPHYYLSSVGECTPPASFAGEEDVVFTGEVRSNLPLLQVRAEVKNAAGRTVCSITQAPEDTIFWLDTSFCRQLDLGGLGKGTYTYTLTASTEKSEEVLASCPFTVSEPPFTIRIQRFNAILSFAEKGTSSLIRGCLSAKLPITKVTLRLTCEGQTPIERTAVPQEGETQYELANLGFNISILPPGDYLVTVEGECGELQATAATGRIIISDPNTQGTANRQKLLDFLSDSANADYFHAGLPWARVGNMKMKVLQSSGRGWAGFWNGMCLVFSNYEDYLNAVSSSVFSSAFNDGPDDTPSGYFLVKVARGEIESLITQVGVDYTDVSGEDSKIAAAIREACTTGDPMTVDMLSVGLKTVPEWLGTFVEIFNAVTTTEPDISELLKTIPELRDILADSCTNYLAANRTLDLLQNRYSAGTYSDCYQEALRELRRDYRSLFSTIFRRIVRTAWEKLAGKVTEEIISLALKDINKNIVPGTKLANAIYRLIGFTGAYDGADQFVSYLLAVESYHAAANTYREKFLEAAANPTDKALSDVDASFRFTRDCGLRSVEMLLDMKKRDFDYLEYVPEKDVLDLWKDLFNSAVPFLN